MRSLQAILAGMTVTLVGSVTLASAWAHDTMLRADTGPELPPCTCRANGRDFQMGEMVCLRTSQGPRLARCVMVLNNTSWEPLPQSCPSAELTFTPRPRA